MPPITLSPQDKQTLIDLEQLLPEAEEELRRAESAGLDVTQLRAQFERSKTLRDGLLRVYGGS